MKVILKEDVQGLGKKDDMVNASNGYAKNYLVPKGLAVEENVSNIYTSYSKKGKWEHATKFGLCTY